MTEPSGEKLPAERARILVVDDDPHTRNLLRDLCEASGYAVTQAEDGVQTLEKLAEGQFDLVLLDLMMPRKDGFTVLKEIRESGQLHKTPVIILTAIGDMDGKIRGMELGADDYVTKPFKLVELQTRITAALSVRAYRSKLHTVEEELSQLRALDPVTGTGTYAQLKASLDSELSRARRYGRPLSLLLLGFEDYQSLRGQLGRDGANAFVGKLAGTLKEGLRGADLLFRMDVEEFVALLPETDLAGARICADRLVERVRALFVDVPGGGRAQVSLKVGGANFPHPKVQSGEDLLREANRVYRAVRNDTGSTVRFEPS